MQFTKKADRFAIKIGVLPEAREGAVGFDPAFVVVSGPDGVSVWVRFVSNSKENNLQVQTG